MLSFKALSERKTKIKINPKQSEITEKKGCSKCGEESCECDAKKKKCPECNGKGCKHCGGSGYHDEDGEGADMSEAKKKDDTYLETDFKKRQKNNEKARKDLMKGPQMKNPHFESKWYDPMEDPDFDHDEAERTRGQSGKPAKKKTKKSTKKEEVAYVSQEEVSEESTKESKTETFLTFKQFNEDRAADAKKSLDAVKKRQGVLDTHEKKTGKKLDITKTPEHKAHKKNFPGAKRQEKKVRGAKETPSETQDRRIRKATERIVKRGYTSKEKKEVKAMAKHTSRFD
ncbi:hypothetical protein RW260905_176 [Synechococcus phage S-RIM2]|uniref:Uncharacterized protein n=1 Tax=Synechococcus phage S-RIM2 TaxID=687800 RepID=A0A1D7RXS6_9CAUD|nr:hypothetical protein RW260905_176 [Synechococcus phage S-RIM2]